MKILIKVIQAVFYFIVLVIAFGFIISLLAGILPPVIWSIIFIILSAYFIVRFIWLLSVSQQEGIIFKKQTIENINSSICPLCGKNNFTNALLTIGYRKRRYSNFDYRVFYIKYSVSSEELSYKINICSTCRDEYLRISKSKLLFLFYPNPSKKVLKRKAGYSRGIKFPFEEWNLSIK
jgi:hypothetical protein